LLFVSLDAFALPVISYVYDGDTVKISENNIEYKLRLTDIDAPEKAQSYGLKSRRALMKLCLKANIQAVLSGTDKYQRRLGKLTCNGQDASLFMVKNGHAWFNNRYSMNGKLFNAEQEARKSKLGLWQDKNPISPWVWRKQQWRKNHPHNTAK
jgi:micrococcal nuclease